MIREYRKITDSDSHPTVRACCMIAGIASNCGSRVSSKDEDLRRICTDMLYVDPVGANGNSHSMRMEI